MTTTRRINDLITIVNDEQDVEERVYKLAEYVKADYNKYGYKSDFNVTVSKGRKYFKIVTFPSKMPRDIFKNKILTIGFDPKLFTTKMIATFFNKTS